MTVICILLAELFTSLSDDSQRLFVRLYTRKGFFFFYADYVSYGSWFKHCCYCFVLCCFPFVVPNTVRDLVSMVDHKLA